MPRFIPFFLIGLLVAAIIAMISEMPDPANHEGEEEQPTDCVPGM